jgi:Glyoxalase-like domain
MSMRIDHVIVGVSDLDAAAGRFLGELGLDSLPGGRHPGWGTGNRIVPLGQDYIELLAVVDPDEAATSEIGRLFASRIGSQDGPIGWCVATDELTDVAGRLGLPINTGSRALPDGSFLRWRAAGPERALADPSLPFFITWDIPAERHPGRDTVRHKFEPRGISWIEVGGDAARLLDWLGSDELPVRVTPGPSAVLAVGIETAAGEIVLR